MGRSGYIYLIHAKGTNRYKIGLTTRTVEERFAELNSSQSPYPLELIISAEFPNVHHTEKSLHQKYRSNRAHGEWFVFSHRELRRVIKDIRGVKSTFSMQWLLIAAAIALGIILFQHFGYKHQPKSQEVHYQW